ncbi:MAG: hypothetical protein RJA22_921 [Verrucomicrobiota bacterium]|jgi:folate-binding protein YgfZ
MPPPAPATAPPQPLALHALHEARGARFTTVGGAEAVAHYGNPRAEYDALRQGVALLDLGFRSRLCVTGADRQRFLHGQVTNDILALRPGQGCYAALVNNKGRVESDLHVHCLPDELLLDFEPGLTPAVTRRLERFIVADDVQLLDVSAAYGHLAILGPRAATLAQTLAPGLTLPAAPLQSLVLPNPGAGDHILIRQPRAADDGFDLFAPAAQLPSLLQHLWDQGATPAGWQALEWMRVEAGLPRCPVDMDESVLAPEARLDARAISPSKGCYVGQEILNRLRTFAHVNRLLCGLRLDAAPEGTAPPAPGDRLCLAADGRDIGHLTTQVSSPVLGPIALGYVRREASAPGTPLLVRTAGGNRAAVVADLPFTRPPAQTP